MSAYRLYEEESKDSVPVAFLHSCTGNTGTFHASPNMMLSLDLERERVISKSDFLKCI